MRSWLRRQRWWVDLRRWQREGFSAAFRRWRTYSRILETAPVRTGLGGDTEVHLLCYRNDYLGAIWALKTFYWRSASSLPLAIHIQGEATREMRRHLRKHFPDARVIEQSEADALVIPELRRRGLNRLLAARVANHYMLKLTDFVLLAKAENLVTLDSDVLFFQFPEALLRPTQKHLFQRDPQSTYVLDPDTARAELHIEMVGRINVGMMRFSRDRLSLARCDEYLAAFPALDGWLEQTLYALHASEVGNAEFLPDDYLISLSAGDDHSKLVARHYAGPSRRFLHEQGIPYLLRKPLR